MVKTAFNFSFYGQWSFLCGIPSATDISTKKKQQQPQQHQNHFIKFPFRWHSRNYTITALISILVGISFENLIL